MASDQFNTLKGIAQFMTFCGWVVIVLSVLTLFFAIAPRGDIDIVLPLFVLPGSMAGAVLGLIVMAQGQFLACIVQMSRDLQDIVGLNTAMLSAHRQMSSSLQMAANLNSEVLSAHEGSVGENPDSAASSPHAPSAGTSSFEASDI